MLAFLKTTAIAGFGVATLAFVTPAAADRGGDIAAGIIGGAVVGSILGQRTEPRPVYVVPAQRYRSGCVELRERALDAEDRGWRERARYLWSEYRACLDD